MLTPTPTATAFPASDEVMAALFVLATGDELLLEPDTGRMAVMVRPGEAAIITGDALDELMSRGWIAVHDETKLVELTEKGAYWLEKWTKAESRKLRQHRR